MTVPFCIPIRNEFEFLLFHILPSMWCYCFGCGHSDRCVVVPHCFNLQSLMTYCCVFFICYCHLFICFGELTVPIFCPLFNRVACFLITEFYKFFIYLDACPLSAMCFISIFSQSGLFLHFPNSVLHTAKV